MASPRVKSGNDRTRAINKALIEARRMLKAGNLGGADQITRQILNADPVNLDAMHLRARSARRKGDAQTAIALLMRVIKLNPGHAGAHCDLGPLLHAQNQQRNAEGHLRDALKTDPRLARAHLYLGDLYADQARLGEAEKAYKTALRIKPGMIEALGNLALVQMAAGQATAAVKSARAAVKSGPRHPTALSRLAMTLENLGQVDEALAIHEKAVALAPDVIQLRLDQAATLAAHGHIDAALTANRAILQRAPRHAGAYAQITRLKKFSSAKDADLVAMLKILATPNLAAPAQKALNFAVGKAFENLSMYDSAFDAFTAANLLARRQFNYVPETSAGIFADIKKAYGPELFDGLEPAPSTETPIFVVGMPRSGTSLAAQILAAHPAIAGTGELGSLNMIAAELTSRTAQNTHQAALAALKAETLDGWAVQYRDAASVFAGPGQRTADKMPTNYLYIGLIKLLFPKASIVHCRRNAADTCLSIYKTGFARGNLPYAYDPDEIAQVYALYQDLMAHWDALFPGQIFTLDYETLIENGRDEMHRLLTHCGVDWHDDVANFHKAATPVRTASVAQVRQPLNRASLGLAGRYGQAAHPLFEALKKAGIQ